MDKFPAEHPLTPKHRRTILEQLTRDRLAELTARFEVDVEDRRSVDAHIDAIVRKRSIDFTEVLNLFKREELQLACAALDLDTSGREKNRLIDRILACGEAAGLSDVAGPGYQLTPSEPPRASKRGAVQRSKRTTDPVADYRHAGATRANNPPAGLIEFDKPPAKKSRKYAYDPHLDPQLIWAGKGERTSFEVDTVSLHIHERVSTQAILRTVRREDAQRDLFAENDLPEGKAIEFYSHEIGWSNRLVLGDSLLVMNSLLERERMAGKVQCVYMDPPYGVSYNSNFQPSLRGMKDVKDGDDQSLTREPEQIQAYRDTWELGVHSYLSYLRDRLTLAHDLLAESGSVFVQISDQNVHHVRELLDEVFGPENFCSHVVFRKKTMPLGSSYFEQVCDHILWYARSREHVKSRPLFRDKSVEGDTVWCWVELASGKRLRMSPEQVKDHSLLPKGSRVYRLVSMLPAQYRKNQDFIFEFEGTPYPPPKASCWKTDATGMARLAKCGRLQAAGDSLNYVMFLDDYPSSRLTALWDDTAGATDKIYVVQTTMTAIERCVVASTDPGDLVLDPTCGSGTTAVVAEHWGRRWISCDTSRVALALARQRLLTAKYPYFRLRGTRVKDGFEYRTAAHVSLETITHADRVDASKSRKESEQFVRANSNPDTLYNHPVDDPARIRVSGPFTVEAIPIASLEDPGALEDVPLEEPTEPEQHSRVSDPAGDYLTMMVDLVRKSGVVFAKGRHLNIPSLRAVKGSYEYLHAEGESDMEGDPRRIAVSFGSKHAPVTPVQVRNALSETRGYDWVLFVGFGCDPEARRMIDQGVHGRQLDFANAAPDILVGDLLKTRRADKLFSVYGAPDAKLRKEPDAMVSVELVGVDLYDPITGNTIHGNGEDVAAWFVDHDYDGRSFCICQALFPGRSTKNPWEKLQKALKGTIDERKFELLRTTRSLPFKPGKKVAITVIDDRGNEVITVVDATRVR